MGSKGVGKVVCVTGASGYIASWLVKLLLHHHYTVHATVRNLSLPRMLSLSPLTHPPIHPTHMRDSMKVEHLMSLEGAQERLHLFEANLMDEGSFDSAVDGCECVFHAASPVVLAIADPQTELLEPAVKGTLNVLKSCKKAPSVRRVVVTSSMASVMINRKPRNLDVPVDETWFSDPVFCEETKQWYPLSKTLAEEAAWKFADENNIDMVTLHPGFVIGPMLQPTLNLTSEAFLNLITEGKEIFTDGVYRYVDVRDVVYAHVLAFENLSASGRYCLVGTVIHSSEFSKVLNQLYPSLDLFANVIQNQATTDPPYQISKERATSLGVNFTPLEVSIKDTVENLQKNSFLSF